MLNHTPRKGELVLYQAPGEEPIEYEIMGYKDDTRQIANIRDTETGDVTQIIVRFANGKFNTLLEHYQDERGVNYTTQPLMHG